jgi:hypothetical protein
MQFTTSTLNAPLAWTGYGYAGREVYPEILQLLQQRPRQQITFSRFMIGGVLLFS